MTDRAFWFSCGCTFIYCVQAWEVPVMLTYALIFSAITVLLFAAKTVLKKLKQ